jgi:hypothetical protein
MSVENKIKELLENVKVKASLDEAAGSSSNVTKDSSIKPANGGDSSSPKQGSSEDASHEDRGEQEANQGAITAKGVSKNTIAMKGSVGAAPNFTTVQGTPNLGASWPAIPMNTGISEEEEVVSEADTDSTINDRYKDIQTSVDDKGRLVFKKDKNVEVKSSTDDQGRLQFKDTNRGNETSTDKAGKIVYRRTEDVDTEDDENMDELSEADQELNIDMASIFGEDLSEEFREKATSIFEAAVIAKVNDEMERVCEALEEKYSAEFNEYTESIVEKVDAYLNYVVENYMEENKLAVENGLRTEIAEDFMTGLKALFKEHYIEVPEEKYDVIGELQDKVSELEESLNQQFENNVDLNSEVSVLKKSLIIKEMSDDLADTEVNKLTKLLAGVEFENEEIYMEKVAVIKENYFPNNANKESVTISQTQPLMEDTSIQEHFDSNDVVSSYAKALTRTIKRV